MQSKKVEFRHLLKSLQRFVWSSKVVPWPCWDVQLSGGGALLPHLPCPRLSLNFIRYSRGNQDATDTAFTRAQQPPRAGLMVIGDLLFAFSEIQNFSRDFHSGISSNLFPFNCLHSISWYGNVIMEHELVNYCCNECHFQASSLNEIVAHIESTHIKFCCPTEERLHQHAQCYMSSRSLNKAKRRQESGKGSSGGSFVQTLLEIWTNKAYCDLFHQWFRLKSLDCGLWLPPNEILHLLFCSSINVQVANKFLHYRGNIENW